MIDQILAEAGFKMSVSLVILTVGLLMCRILPIVILSPMLGGESTPSEVKIGLGVLLSIVLFPAVADRVSLVPVSALGFIAVLFKEIFIGLCLSTVVSMVFEAARAAGTMVDTQAGASQAQVHVPQVGTQVTIFSSFKLMLAVTLFLTLNGHHVVISALADSLVVIPLDRFPTFGRGLWPFFDLMMRVFADMMRVGLALAAPAMIAAFLTDLALGMINRVAPQLQVFFISMAIKPLVATVMVMLAINAIMERMHVEFLHSLRLFHDAIELLK
ncbi:MAG TPA: flagellar biosynthetic protein FliR [Myxococcaceae bacterium]|nr:flagellar biosynthetic protein FliR [Myxococcaceae bacterium]